MSEFGKDINVPSRKGVFIPDITVEMLRNASLEGVEDLLASGEMEDISLTSAQQEARWILCGEKLPNEEEEVLVTSNSGIFIAAWSKTRDNKIYWYETVEGKSIHKVTAWMPLPEPYGGPLPD